MRELCLNFTCHYKQKFFINFLLLLSRCLSLYFACLKNRRIQDSELFKLKIISHQIPCNKEKFVVWTILMVMTGEMIENVYLIIFFPFIYFQES